MREYPDFKKKKTDAASNNNVSFPVGEKSVCPEFDRL